MNGNEKGKASPTPENTLLRTNDKANATFRCSTLVWSAMIAFHDDSKAPSPPPAARAEKTIHRTLRGIAEKPKRLRRAGARGSGVSIVSPFQEGSGASVAAACSFRWTKQM